MLEAVTPLILTFNEAPNIKRTLQRLCWAETIVVIDSYSSDETLEILQSYTQVQIFQRKFDTHTNQWNYGLQQVKSEWVLSLDADYIVSDDLISEINDLPKEPPVDGYLVRFKYCVFGKPLRGTLLPPREVLFRKEKSIYIDDGHTQLLQVIGNSSMLKSYIYHDDQKPVSRWFQAEIKYAVLEAKKLLEIHPQQLSFVDKLRLKKVLTPFIILFYCLVLKGGIFDGWRGWYYAFQRTLAEILLAIHLIQNELLTKQKNSLP